MTSFVSRCEEIASKLNSKDETENETEGLGGL